MPHPTPLDDREQFIKEAEEWRRQQADPTVPDHLLGLKGPRPDDPRDWLMPGDPRIADALSVALPDNADLVAKDKHTYNQLQWPACVVHSGAYTVTVFQWDEEGVIRVIDAMRAHQETGPMDQGRWPEDVLKHMKAKGLPIRGGEQRYRISGYAFAPKGPGTEWEEVIAAAIVAGRPVMICFLLPQQFGWESGGAITSGYHEVVIIGFRTSGGRITHFLVKNSWGESWGRNGMGWVAVDFLKQQNYQNGYVLAHTVVDELANPNPQPQPPTPTPTAGVSGLYTGPKTDALAPGVEFAFYQGTIKINTVVWSNVTPTPNPPNPDPPIPIGELEIEATPNGTGWCSFRVTDPTGYVNARVSVDLLPGQEKITQKFGAGRAIAATFWLGHVRGQVAVVTARELNGTRTGMRTVTA